MRNILRRSLILVLLLVTFFVVAMEASAVTLDGLEIQIQTDKEEYAAYDPISVTHIITNRNDVPVENIRLETLIPEGYTAEEGGNTVKEVASLAPGEQITLASKLNSLTPKPENGWVTVVLFIVGGLAVAGGIAVGVIFLVRSINKKKAAGEAMDIYQGAPFHSPAIVRSGDYSALEGADIVVITCGMPRKPGMTRLDLAQVNVNILKEVAASAVPVGR